MTNLKYFLIMTLIELTISNNCSVICGESPSQWCCPVDYVCYGRNQCQISYSGNRAWLLVLKTIAPIIFLMIVIIVIACLQHRKDPTGQMQSKSIVDDSLSDGNPSLIAQTDRQIINMFLPERSLYQF